MVIIIWHISQSYGLKSVATHRIHSKRQPKHKHKTYRRKSKKLHCRPNYY